MPDPVSVRKAAEPGRAEVLASRCSVDRVPTVTDVRFVYCKGEERQTANVEFYQKENRAAETSLAWHSE